MRKSKQHGVTVIELITVMAIFSTLFGAVVFSLLTSQAKTTLQSTVSLLLADLSAQQIKSISGNSQGGIYFTRNSYTTNDQSNFVVQLGDNIEFSSISFPAQSIIFSKISGEVVGFDSTQNTVTVRNTQSNEQKTVRINRYGVVTSIN